MKANLRPTVLIVAAGFGVALSAQTSHETSATPSYLPPRDDVMRLAPLEVRADRDAKFYTAERSLTATRTDTPLVNVPQAVSVITRDLIDDAALVGIADLSRHVPGMGIAQGEGNRDTPVMRGNSTTADFFVDGIRDDVQYTRDLYNIERVEVIKGPNAMIFGRGGSGGVLNRVAKQANGATFREFTAVVGSWNQVRASVDIGHRVNDSAALRVAGLYEEADGYRDGFSLQRHGINPTLTLALTRRTTLRAGYEHFQDDRVADRGVSSHQGRPLPTSPGAFFGDPEQSPVSARVNTAFAAVDHRFNNGVALRNHARFGAYRKFYQNVFPGAVNAPGTTVSLSAYNNATDRDNLFNQTEVVVPFATGGVKHQFLGGVEVARQETDNLRLTGYFTGISPTTTSVVAPLSNPRISLPLTFAPGASDASNHGVARSAAVYAQDQVALWPRLHALLGVRLERFEVDFRNNRTGAIVDSTDTLVSPRGGLIYKPADAVSVYGSYSMSHLPRAGEQLSSLSLTNRSLDPEQFTNRELGVKWDVRGDLALTAAVYRLDRRNVAVPDPADPAKSLLVDGQRAEGFELGFTGRVANNWSVVAGYAWQRGVIQATQSATVVAGARLAQLPRHTFSLWNRYDFTRRFGAGVGAISRGEIFASTDNTVRVPGFVRFDAALFYRLGEHVRVQANVENVLDREHFATAHSNTNIMPGSPRAVRVTIGTRF